MVLAALLLVAFRRKEYDGDQSGGIETVVASLAASGWDVARSCGISDSCLRMRKCLAGSDFSTECHVHALMS